MIKKIKKVLQKIQYKDIERGAREISYMAFDLAEWIVIAGIGILSSALLGLLVFKIMAVGGLSAVLAQLMASTCQPGVTCDFQTRIGAVGLALVVVTIFFITTIKLIDYRLIMFEYTDKNDMKNDEPCRYYNGTQVELLRLIQSMNGIKNLRKFANIMGVPYTTARNYMDQFERDGYIRVKSNGKGAPVEIEYIS